MKIANNILNIELQTKLISIKVYDYVWDQLSLINSIPAGREIYFTMFDRTATQ